MSGAQGGLAGANVVVAKPSGSGSSSVRKGSGPLPDRQLVRAIWPILVASALGLVPFTVMATFLTPIAGDAGIGVEILGSFRGLGGLAALFVGVAAAPLLDRLSRTVVAALALVVLAAGCALSVLSSPAAWVVFCLFIGAGTAVLNPALSALAADRFANQASSARAATLVSSTTTLTAVLCAPLLALPALWWGWRADMLAAALALLVVALLLGRQLDSQGARTTVGYFAAFRVAARIPGALGLVAISLLRTAAFMGSLAYAAAAFFERFDLGPGLFSLVWSSSGLAFFVGNFFGGRLAQHRGGAAVPVMLVAGLAVATVGMLGLYTAPSVLVSWALVALVAASHAVVAAAVTTGLVRASGELRGTVLGLAGAAQSLGVFAGAAIAGAALAAAHWAGMGAALAALTAIGLAVAVGQWSRQRSAESRRGGADTGAGAAGRKDQA